MGDQVAPAVDDAALQLFLALVHARQHQGRGQELEGAAQREAFVLAMSGAPAGGGVEHADAEPAAAGFLDVRQLLRKVAGPFGPDAEGRGGQRDEKGACELPSMNHGCS
jgi:hypothetical protein